MDQYTIILFTRLRRKVFNAGNVSARAVQLLKESMPPGAYLLGYRVFPSALAFTVSTADGVRPDYVSYAVRKATSSELRSEFKELWKMPSLWTRAFSVTDREAASLSADDIEELSP